MSTGSLKTSACFGTVGYSAPEQCSGEPVDFDVASGLGTLGSADPMTDEEGAARADFLSSRYNGTTRIRVDFDGA